MQGFSDPGMGQSCVRYKDGPETDKSTKYFIDRIISLVQIASMMQSMLYV